MTLGSLRANAQVNVTTYHNDIGRTGQNLNETILTTSNVNATQFGKLFSQTVDAQIYTQPLYLSGITVNGATHNVVYVATENDSVYAFDADSNGGANASPLWFASMLSTTHGAASGATAIPYTMVSTDIQPLVGITGTPVIDPSTGTLYVVSKTFESSKAVQRLHALDVMTGAEKFGGPVVITVSVSGTGNGSSNGTLTFDPLWENQRPALLLLNGIVWIGFASHGDNGPWHGWVLGYNAGTLKQTGAFCPSPNGAGAGIWMSGGGLAADQLDPVNHPYGRMFIPTGNGDYTATKPYNNTMDYGDSHLDLDLTNGIPTVTDEFTTNQQASLNAQDGDIASGGMMVIPTQTTGSYPHLAVQVGKQGYMYLLNRDNLGGYNTTVDQGVQIQPYAVGGTGAWGSPAYWNGNVYWWGKVDYLKSFALVNGLLSTTPVRSSESYGYPGATPSISANGATQGIVWSVDTEAYNNNGPAILQAHNASNVATTLYSSTTNASRDHVGPAVKFATPTIANGKVYVGASGELDFYGLLTSTSASAPVILPGTESFSGSISITITDTTPNAQIYYTTDGSTPTASSTPYTGAITVASSEAINAVASASGYLLSAVSSATYTDIQDAPTVTFSLPAGAYSTTQSLVLSDSATGASIYYTLDGSTPTTSSTLYSSPITISSTAIVTAIALAPGMSASPPASQTYTINLGVTGINFPTGFAGSSNSLVLNGSAQLNDSRLQLTTGSANQAGSAWYITPINIQSFTTDFNFQLSNPVGNGITFTIQNASTGYYALGSSGSGLGYQGISPSAVIKFDFTTPVGSGTNSTGLYLNGAAPTTPAIDLSSSGINLASDDEMAVHLTYNGSILTMTITDMVTSASWSTSWTVNLPTLFGGPNASVGFTGGTGANSSSQKILTWTYSTIYTMPTAATPTFSIAAGTYNSAQNVVISDGNSGATIYYTTDGSAPTTSSTVYSSPVTVSATETLKAIAVATGFSTSTIGSATYTITPTAATPVFFPASGTYNGAQNVTISDTTGGATIYYTTDGSTPTTSSPVYAGPIPVSVSETINAVALATGYSTSAPGSATYAINLAVAAPTFSLPAGTYNSVQNVALSDATAGAIIYYTTNGTTPTTASRVYSSPITVGYAQTIQAAATAPGFALSPVASASYSLAAAVPVMTPAGGTYNAPVTVTMTSATPNSHIFYTTNGLYPTTSSPTYTGPITVSAGETIRALAGETGFTPSPIVSNTYTLATAAPTFAPAAGTYATPQTITISDMTPGTTIYYTTNGSTPTASSAVYSNSVSVPASETMKAIALKTGYTGTVGSAAYTITNPATAAAPTFSLPGGTYNSVQSVALSDATAGAIIYYTTNGTTPTTASRVYSSPITVGYAQTIQAAATAPGFALSPVASASYSLAAAVPVMTPAGGTYNAPVTVTMTSATPNSHIFYTTNGLYPTTSSPTYTGPITVSAGKTVRALAGETGFTPSPIVSNVYVITTGAAASRATAPHTAAASPSLPSGGSVGNSSGAEHAKD